MRRDEMEQSRKIKQDCTVGIIMVKRKTYRRIGKNKKKKCVFNNPHKNNHHVLHYVVV